MAEIFYTQTPKAGVKDTRILGTLKKSNECPICRRAMERLVDLPRYPLTELYEPDEGTFHHGRGYADQALLYCQPCNHGKLETIVPPAMLYGEGYRTRTAASAGAVRAIQNFRKFVGDFADLDRRGTVIDIGGNDGSLLGTFPGARKVNVDPNATDGIRAYIEDADLSEFKGVPKIILSSHTLEHVESAAAMLDKVASIMQHDDLFAIQVPSLELMVRRWRMEQIHHQHIHYYSERSLSALLAGFGLEVVQTRFDEDHYGALMVLCRRGTGKVVGERILGTEIETAWGRFLSLTYSCDRQLGDGFIALGAALMLPVAAYYLPNLTKVEYIADNDRSKDGLRYVNFNKRIRCDYDLAGRDVVITAINTKLACRALAALAFEKGARNVLVPMQML